MSTRSQQRRGEKEAREALPPTRSALRWYCPRCATERTRTQVRLVIAGQQARQVCRECGTTLEVKSIPF